MKKIFFLWCILSNFWSLDAQNKVTQLSDSVTQQLLQVRLERAQIKAQMAALSTGDHISWTPELIILDSLRQTLCAKERQLLGKSPLRYRNPRKPLAAKSLNQNYLLVKRDPSALTPRVQNALNILNNAAGIGTGCGIELNQVASIIDAFSASTVSFDNLYDGWDKADLQDWWSLYDVTVIILAVEVTFSDAPWGVASVGNCNGLGQSITAIRSQPTMNQNSQDVVLAHEIGHTLGGVHDPSGLMEAAISTWATISETNKTCFRAAVGCTILPVELLSFKSIPTNMGNRLDWATASEKDFRGFAVEKIVNGQWKELTFIPSKGDNSSYYYMDESPTAGVSYYRLRLIDIGSVRYSKVISVAHEAETPLELFPNPATAVLNIVGNKAELTEIFNVLGQLMLRSNATKIDIHQLNSGVYFLKNGNHIIKFLKN